MEKLLINVRQSLSVTPQGAIVSSLSAEEREVVGTVAEFVDRDVRPVVRELEHANTYPEKLIEQMKAMGIFGLAIPEPYGPRWR